MRPTPTILFLSILLTIESLVGAAAPKQKIVSNYDVRAYSNMNCGDGYLGQFSGIVTAGRLYHANFPNSNCAVVYAVPTGCSLSVISLEEEDGTGHMAGPFSTGTKPRKVALPFDTVRELLTKACRIPSSRNLAVVVEHWNTYSTNGLPGLEDG
ncbi:hypothetical protein F5876DRAFT_68735 [Lentinula aff. lateritia]|uniref:Uncharacterized protein n=1 Tax=Lentinula aff. lateritia TaxID=2804960 RepID=A0ACC1TQ87_9AGAR|nr:hypothetical protein F5876DRAFT_68735 [Lentinula aff. lateritia]